MATLSPKTRTTRQVKRLGEVARRLLRLYHLALRVEEQSDLPPVEPELETRERPARPEAGK